MGASMRSIEWCYYSFTIRDQSILIVGRISDDLDDSNLNFNSQSVGSSVVVFLIA